MAVGEQRWLVAQTAAQTHWVKRGYSVTLCGLPRSLWYFPDKRRAVTCKTCSQLRR